MRSILLGLLGISLAATAASAQRDLYLGLRAISPDIGLETAIPSIHGDGHTAVLRGARSEDPQLGLFVGFPIQRHLAIEIGYVDLGTTDVLYDPCTPCESLVPDESRLDLDATALTAHAIGLLPLRRGLLTLGAKLGIVLPDVSLSRTQLFAGSSQRFDIPGGLELAAGALLRIDPRGPLAVRLDYDHFPLTPEVDADLLSLGLVWQLR